MMDLREAPRCECCSAIFRHTSQIQGLCGGCELVELQVLKGLARMTVLSIKRRQQVAKKMTRLTDDLKKQVEKGR